ncbi:MAG TPA: MFS transporter [Jatrophihabitantaceae bacterium]|nr:MFS transporter [Jatrophihabitantaceae bacterium]
MTTTPPTSAVTTAIPARRRLLRPGHPGLVLALILVSQLMVVLDATIVNVALHDIRDALHFSAADLSWVINAYTLTFGGLLLLGARAGDILGRRRVFLGGIALFTLASLAGGFAQSPGELLAARALQGVGGALASPSALALLMTMFPQGRERTRAIGYYTAVSIGGAAVGLIAGGMLSQWVSWRWVLFVNVPIGVVLLALARIVLPETPRASGRFDLTGALTSTLGMSALVYGFVHAASDGWSDAETIGSFALGLVLLAAFGITEQRAESPITPLRLFADRNRSSAYVARLMLVAGTMGMFFFLTQFLRGVLGYSDLKTGFAFLPLTLVLFVASQASSRGLVERFGERTIMIVGVTLSTLGMLWLTQLSGTSGYFDLVGPLLVFGTGNGLAFVPLTTAALDGVEPEDAGAASGLVNVMQQLGGSLGLAVLVTVFGTVSQHTAEHPRPGESASDLARRAFVEGADRSFWTATLFMLATFALVTFAIRRGPTAPQEEFEVDDPRLDPVLVEA